MLNMELEDSPTLSVISNMDLEYQLTSLEESLKKVRNKFTVEWTGPYLDSLQQQKEVTFKENMKKHQNKVSSILENIEKLKDEDSRKRKADEELNTEFKHLKASVENINKETDNLLQQCEQMKQEVEKASQQNNEQRKSLEDEDKAAKNKIQELEKAVSFFTDGLGLQLKKVSGQRLQLVFTCIDYKDPTKPFYCFVKINDDRTYNITDCQPPIEDLEKLSQKLNETNNFKAFIITLRKKFKALV